MHIVKATATGSLSCLNLYNSPYAKVCFLPVTATYTCVHRSSMGSVTSGQTSSTFDSTSLKSTTEKRSTDSNDGPPLSSIGAIIGGVIIGTLGGLGFVGLTVLMINYWSKQEQRREEMAALAIGNGTYENGKN